MTHRALPRSATISREALSPYSPAPSHFCYGVTASVLPEERASLFHITRDAAEEDYFCAASPVNIDTSSNVCS